MGSVRASQNKKITPSSNRPSAHRRGYDRDWQKLRDAHLADNPYCKYCEELTIVEPATVVDHITPVRERPDLRLAPDNLQSLCKRCHDSVKQREEHGVSVGCDIDGYPRHWKE
nr:HNH endonuclease [bacterium]